MQDRPRLFRFVVDPLTNPTPERVTDPLTNPMPARVADPLTNPMPAQHALSAPAAIAEGVRKRKINQHHADNKDKDYT